jgi:hypothetical protein
VLGRERLLEREAALSLFREKNGVPGSPELILRKALQTILVTVPFSPQIMNFS